MTGGKVNDFASFRSFYGVSVSVDYASKFGLLIKPFAGLLVALPLSIGF